MRLDRRLLIPLVVVTALGAATMTRADSYGNTNTDSSPVAPPATASDRTITVIGTGCQAVSPGASSESTMNFNLNSGPQPSIPAAVANLSKIDSAVRKALLSINLPASDVQNQNLNISGGFAKYPYLPSGVPPKEASPSFTINENLLITAPSSSDLKVISVVYAAEDRAAVGGQAFNV